MKKKIYFQNVFDQQLEVLVIGDLKKNTPTVVLLHEGLGSLEMWKDIPEELFKELDLNIFVYSRAGYGKSSIVNLPRPINYMNLEAEKYLPKLLLEFNLKNVFLLGHSDGATIAAINSTLENNNYKILGTILIAPHFFIEEMNIVSIREIRNIYEHNLKKKLSKYHSNPDVAFYGWNDVGLDDKFKDWNITKMLKDIKIPILAIQGKDDPYGTLAQIEVLEKNIKGKLNKLILNNCGHNPLIDKPKESINKIKDFINQIEYE